MPFIFPTRTTASSVQDHVADHNLLASLLERAGGFAASSTRQQHLAEHNAIHPAFSLPARTSESAAIHLTDSQTMYANVVAVYSGVRGTVGTRASASIPEYPGSFTSSHSTFASLQSAVNAAGTGRKFEITGDIPFTATIQPHANDEFWGNAANRTITRSGAVHSAIKPASAVNGIKVMNLKFSGFDDNSVSSDPTAVSIAGVGCADWEVGYCEMTLNGLAFTMAESLNCRVHHCYIHGNGVNSFEINVCFGGIRAEGFVMEDCEVTDGSKFAAPKPDLRFRHNYVHNVSGRPGLWFDTQAAKFIVEWNNFDANQIGISIEGCSNKNGDVVPLDVTDKNICRYNYIHNQVNTGAHIQHSRWVEMYYNHFNDNITSADANHADIMVELATAAWSQGYDVDHNYFHHNYISPAADTRKVAKFNITTSAVEEDYYNQNGKNNNWNYNDYDSATVGTTTNQWIWNGNKNWTQWLVVAQGSEGTGATQDLHGARV